MGELTGTWTIAPTTVAEAAAGDPDALARIVRAHHDDMARVCFVICGDADLAQDAVQAAWPRLAQAGDAARPVATAAVARQHRRERSP